MTAVATAAAVLVRALSSATATTSTSSAKPAIVLVHGGFADGSNWSGVIRKLQRQGYPTIAPANPLQTDAPYLTSVMMSISGPIVLVGHSYGAAVITNAAAGVPNVKALVYIAAFVPNVGETLGALISKYPRT